MIDLDNAIFTNHISTLKDTSLDKREKETYYMTSSARSAINFDDVKNEYIKSLDMSETPSSNDALFEDGNGSVVFVEFKNKKIDSKTQYRIRRKIY